MAYPKTDEFFNTCMRVLIYDASMGVFMQRQFNKDKTVSWLEPAGRRTVYGVRLRIEDHEVFAHHLAWRMARGYWPNNHIKHKDGDNGNNRFENLHSPGEDRKRSKKSEIVEFLNSLGMSERQINRLRVERIRDTQGEKAAIDAELAFQMSDKEEHERQISELGENT